MKLENEIKTIPIDKKLVFDYKDGSQKLGIFKRQHEKEIFDSFLKRSKYKLINPLEEVIDLLMERLYFEFIYEEIPYTPVVIDAKKHAKGRTLKERNERRTGDFIKNTLPTLAKEDRNHFERKYKLKSSTQSKKKRK